MSLQFYFGASGAGKSSQLHRDILKAAADNPKRNYLFIVPDQFTMQTQMDLVTESPNHVIMNIDILSFGRLTHRILEEVGGDERPVLDDTGKSLVLRKVAEMEKENLVVMGSRIHKIGYIHEVKSALSEFMQYGIGEEELKQLIEYSKTKGALCYKLKDLATLYSAFLSYIKDHFITSEETLDRLCAVMAQSEVLRDSVVIFDGFTGFTPIQNRVIRELMKLSSKVILAMTIDERENPYRLEGEQKLFYLTQKTVSDMRRIATEVGIEEESAVYCKERVNDRLPRFAGNPELGHLERNLFRYPLEVYEQKPENIRVFNVSTPKEEIRQTCIAIKKMLAESLLKDGGTLQYRDIAVVTGNMENYAKDMEEEFAKFEIPFYLDVTRGILGNPFVEYIRSALQIVLRDFDAESVMHYMRTGLAGFERDKVDRLENYVRRFGIRGYRKWSTLFIYKEKRGDDKQEEQEEAIQELAVLNEMREKLLLQIAPLLTEPKTVGDWVKAVYSLLVNNGLEQKMSDREKDFAERQDLSRAKEYGQIYRVVVDLLDQIHGLLETEEISGRDFSDILDSGFAEISVGTIPQNVDRVVIGDIERTRLKQVKVLFFLGVNDGNIPKSGSSGGIISDIEREFLQESEWELAPTPRQQMYIQRLYLYLNLTKPSDKLYLSYARISNEGRSMRPAYLIDVMLKMFPQLQAEEPEREPIAMQLVNGQDGMYFVAGMLREYAGRRLNDEQKREFYTLFRSYQLNKEYAQETEQLVETAFYRHVDSPLSKVVVQALYGNTLYNSVSRLERYAACAYEHFLQYGLRLKERGDYSFENVDMGNLFHEVLEIFADKLALKGYTWFDFPTENAEEFVEDALQECANQYGESILYSSARNLHLLKRIARVLKRTVITLQYQLKKGSFVPEQFEMSFSSIENIQALNIALGEEEKMHLHGKIDRIDTCETGDKIYVKVIDYKSGNKKFDLAALYYGLQLQLVVYMNAAVEMQQKKHPEKEIVPAAMLYYHVADPMIEGGMELTEDKINELIRKELKMNGVVNDEDEIIQALDKGFTDKSDILPLERKKDGSFSAKSGILSDEDMRMVSNYVNHKIKNLGKGILQGDIAMNPYEQGSEQACTYCAYRRICGFDAGMDGYQTRKLPKMNADEVVQCMREELEG